MVKFQTLASNALNFTEENRAYCYEVV